MFSLCLCLGLPPRIKAKVVAGSALSEPQNGQVLRSIFVARFELVAGGKNRHY